MRAEKAYISIGTNRSSSCAASSSKGLVAFGAGRFVALWDTDDEEQKGIQATLPGHKGLVTTVKLLHEDDERLAFVSGDSLGEVRIWERTTGWRCSVKWDAHPGSSISAIGVSPRSAFDRSKTEGTILTGASDGSVKVWKLSPQSSTKPQLTQTIDLKGKLPLDLELAYLPGSAGGFGSTEQADEEPVLAMGCTDRRIRLFTQQEGEWKLAISLEGHEDWVRCLSWTVYPPQAAAGSSSSPSQDLLLASGSQDNYIRLWRVSPVPAAIPNSHADGSAKGLDMLDEFERKLAGDAGGSVQISTKAHVLAVSSSSGTVRFNVTLEALLLGHESGLTNLHFSPPSSTSPPILLSTASDNSMIIWTPSLSSSSAADGIWVPEHRFGNVGGRGLAFSGALWGKERRSVMAGGWNGGWERWVKGDEGEWVPKAGVMGHFGEVESVVWDPKGDYLLSVGSDQTSRIHASCNPPNAIAGSSRSTGAEIARPQIHGYDMTDAAFLSPYRFASGADEKVTRVFDAPGGFVQSLQSLGVTSGSESDTSARPKGATVPPLGLSNRALGKAPQEVEIGGTHVKNGATDSISQILNDLPTEEELSTSTLWPEIEKIYGHGYETVCVAAAHDGKVLATACKATNLEHAAVRLIDTSTWDPIGAPLEGHTLTITRIAFSPDDEHILTCSRDRGWRIFSRGVDWTYTLSAGDERAHARMVLDAAWSPGGGMFATASRDKCIKVWKRGDEGRWEASNVRKCDEGVTAVDFASAGGSLLWLAMGTESGAITVLELDESDPRGMKEVLRIPADLGHVGPINRLAFRPAAAGRPVQLASGSEDRSVRIFNLVP